MPVAAEGCHLPLQSKIESICNDHLARMAAEIGRAAEAGLEGARQDAAAETGAMVRAIAEAIRRIRGTEDSAGALAELAGSATKFCRRAILLLHSGGTLIGFRSAGEEVSNGQGDLARLSFDLASAPAIARAVESRQAVIAAATQASISEKLWSHFPFEEGEEVRVHPLVLRNVVIALVLVDGAAVQSAAVEALVMTTEAWIEALQSRQEQGAKWKLRG